MWMGAATGKLGPTGIGVVLHNNGGVVITMFSKHAGNLDSSTAKVLAIPEVLRIFQLYFHLCSIVDSNSANAVHWVSSPSTSL